MDITKHCVFCNNKSFNLSTGVFCGLTDKKPEFKLKCPDIKFDSNEVKEIEVRNIELELIKSKKSFVLTNSIFYSCTGLVFIVGGLILMSYLWNAGWVSTVPFGLIGIGAVTLPYGLGIYKKYKNRLDIAIKEKVEMDSILGQYNEVYTIQVDIETDIHGHQNIQAKVNFTKRHSR